MVDTLDLGVAEALPIASRADELIAALRAHQVVVVAGETGSGKSTQLPKLCLAAGRGSAGMIAHTQPRRVAARTVAERVGSELGAPDRVAWSVRFDDRASDQTLVRVMTDGILLNEIQRDRDLRRYDTIIVDEAHERSLNIDFILGYLKQLLPRRPDLHVVVTSATIDTERFAEHFADVAGAPAPVFVVEGRTYPVDIRYRPYEEAHGDQVRAVIEAVDELHAEAPGDVLVFLSGEREIHDVADALREHDQRIEVLPLYARLSAAEQHRIFTASNGRRVVLSTNVAETSLTVPGVRYVVDAGTARISRYSRRLKVQRLPIEPISQASANQRAGRCGRVAPGVCIRLYDEVEFAARAEFTEPEVLRTNLASVILQMTAIGLGDVSRFPFVEAPDSSQVRDGYLLLEELGALREGTIGQPRKLTEVGRQLARLPIDPRLGRMVIEAERRHCVREVLVIASALSIQDVRERPSGDPDERAAAVGLHRRFAVEGSDLLSVVALWDYLGERQAELSGNRFRRMCRDEHLNYLRVREWRDLYSQLRQVAGSLGIRPEQHARGDGVTAHPDHVHRAVLAGLLSHIGEYDKELREYRGARDSRFSIVRDSVLVKRPPKWVMAAELVETNRLWARRVATIQPEWAEQAAAHLVKRSYSEAWWDPASGRALTAETVTLYGRPIVANRTIGVDRVDPRLAREMFVRHALLDRDVDAAWLARHDFFERNERFLARVALLEARVRRGDLVDPEALYDFYDARLGADVTSIRHFDMWWKSAGREQPDRLDFTRDVLASRSGIRLADYPDTWPLGDMTCRLSYRYDPGTPLDGATLTIPLTALQLAVDTGLPGRDWLIPGYRAELVDLLVRSLPKDLRRTLIPLTDTAARAAARLAELVPGLPDESAPALLAALAEVLAEMSGQPIRAADFDTARLPEHLRVHLVVVDAEGIVVDAGDDLAAIAARQSGSARAAVAASVTADGFAERHDIVRWDDIGSLERVIEQRDPGGHLVRAYPTLLDKGDRVALRVVDNPSLQQRAMRGGVRRLLLMAAAPTPAKVAKTLDGQAQLAIAAAGFDVGNLVAECIEAAVDAILARSSLPWDAAAFGRIERSVSGEAAQLAADALAESADVLGAAGRVNRRLLALTAGAARATTADAAAHLERLVAPGFVRRTGTDRLPDVHRYVRGIEYRLDHLAGDIARDQRRMAEVRPLERAYAEAVERLSRVSDEVRAVAWLLEEYRLSVFAAPVGVHGQVSPKRIRDAYKSATGSPLDPT